MPVETAEQKTELTTGQPVNPEALEIDRRTGQQKGYVVLSPEERAKGFVRPVRRSYIHTGRPVCGKIRPPSPARLGGNLDVCCLEVGHEGECWGVFQPLTNPDAQRAEREHVIGGCGTLTKMGQALSETYARDPKFYSGTFCCSCRDHFPVGERGEFVWEDGTRVGS